MISESEVLAIVGDRLTAHGVPFMLTGSFALGYYVTPRMTRDLDIVVALDARSVDADYLQRWAPVLGVQSQLRELLP
jgi:hypothetical protein